MSNGGIKAALIIILLLLALALICSWVAGSKNDGNPYIETVELGRETPSPVIETQPSAPLADTAFPNIPETAPSSDPVYPSIEPVVSPSPSFDPLDIPSPVIVIEQTTESVVTPTGTVLGSGTFRSETGVSLNIFTDWAAVTTGSDTVDVTIKVTLKSYSINLVQARSLNLCLGDQYVTLNVPAIDYSGNSELSTVLGSYTFTVNLSDGSAKTLPLAVEWHFGGTYQNTDLPVIECGGQVTLQR